MPRRLLALISTIFVAACTDPPTAERALDDMGFKEVKVTGYRLFSCGEDYAFHTGFEATNANGKHISGAVCSGWLKGSSVKLD